MCKTNIIFPYCSHILWYAYTQSYIYSTHIHVSSNAEKKLWMKNYIFPYIINVYNSFNLKL